MTLGDRILSALPATGGELATILRVRKSRVNSMLWYLQDCGRAERTDRRGAKDDSRPEGRYPHLWARKD